MDQPPRRIPRRRSKDPNLPKQFIYKPSRLSNEVAFDDDDSGSAPTTRIPTSDPSLDTSLNDPPFIVQLYSSCLTWLRTEWIYDDVMLRPIDKLNDDRHDKERWREALYTRMVSRGISRNVWKYVKTLRAKGWNHVEELLDQQELEWMAEFRKSIENETAKVVHGFYEM